MSNAPRTDEQEAIYRAEWLTKHGAPIDWVVLTVNEVAELKRELAASKTENTYIRGQLSSVKCPYGHKTPEGVCALGYPGCSCADDWFASQDEMHKRMCERLAAVTAERDEWRCGDRRLPCKCQPDVLAFAAQTQRALAALRLCRDALAKCRGGPEAVAEADKVLNL